MEYRNIERLRAIVERAITRTDSTLDYPRTLEAIERLAKEVSETETGVDVWYLGECTYSLDSILVGSYWHLVEWHAGGSSDSYRAMCAVGSIFKPGFADGPEPNSCELDVYVELNNMAETSRPAFT